MSAGLFMDDLNSVVLFLKDHIVIREKFVISGKLSEKWVRLEELDSSATKLLTGIEDRNFFFHEGFSPRDIQSALVSKFFFQKKLRGASTITQQLARTLFLNREKTLARKFNEIEISNQLEKRFSKKEILELYINTVYWGRGLHGLYSASELYFGKNPRNLSPKEMNTLFQILKRPDYYSRQKIRSGEIFY